MASSNFATFSSSSQTFYPSAILFTSIILSFFGFFFLFLLLLLLFLSFFFFLFFSSAFTIPVFSTSVSTASHIYLDILSGLLPLFFSQFQNCDKQAMAFLKSYSTSSLWLYLSLFSPYAPNDKYWFPPCAQLVPPC